MDLSNSNPETTDKLRSIPLFSELSIPQLKELTEISELKHIPNNEILFFEGDYYKGFYVLLKGLVKIYGMTPDGKESVVHILKPITTFADVPLFEGKDYPVNAQTLEDCQVLFIPKQGFIDLIKNNSDISLKMLAGFSKRLRYLVAQIEDLSTKDVKHRLAKYLLKETISNGTDKLPEPFFKLSVPKSTIAAYLGTITETLSRAFKKLQDEEIIRVNGKKIFVKDMKRLKELAK